MSHRKVEKVYEFERILLYVFDNQPVTPKQIKKDKVISNPKAIYMNLARLKRDGLIQNDRFNGWTTTEKGRSQIAPIMAKVEKQGLSREEEKTTESIHPSHELIEKMRSEKVPALVTEPKKGETGVEKDWEQLFIDLAFKLAEK